MTHNAPEARLWGIKASDSCDRFWLDNGQTGDHVLGTSARQFGVTDKCPYPQNETTDSDGCAFAAVIQTEGDSVAEA